MGRLRAQWRNLLGGFWLVPMAVAIGLAGLAFGFVAIDRAAGPAGVDFAFAGDAGAARDILSTIASSLITVAGVTFSLTIVVLTLISSQFTPRAVGGFLGDRFNQIVAGSFIGIFLYCLIVLRSVKGGSVDPFLPALGVSGAIALGVGALILLLLFIHHMGRSIQVSHIAARIGRETLVVIDRLLPGAYSGARDDDLEPLVRRWLESGEPAWVTPSRPGYVHLVDQTGLVERARAGTRIHVKVQPGDFVTEETQLVRVWPATALGEEDERAFRSFFPIASERDLLGDPSHGLRQLSDIAVKALSPGINDPTTAVTCVGYLRAALERIAGRAVPDRIHRLDEDAVVAFEQRGFDEYAERAFDEIGRFGVDNTRVVLAVSAALCSIAAAARRAGADERLPILLELGEAISESALGSASNRRDRKVLTRELARLRLELRPRPT